MRMREELTLPGRHHVVDVNSRPNLARLYAGNVSETKRITTAGRHRGTCATRGPLRDARYHVIYHITENDCCCLYRRLTLSSNGVSIRKAVNMHGVTDPMQTISNPRPAGEVPRG